MEQTVSVMADVAQMLGGLIVAWAYVPQIRQVLRTKSAGDFNLQFLISLCLGIALMEFYALVLVMQHGSGLAFLASNSISLILVSTLATLAHRFQEQSTNT